MKQKLTRIEKNGDFYFKREDEYEICGVSGSKARAAYDLIQIGLKNGYKKFCTAGSRLSPQCQIVSRICKELNLECDIFMPTGEDTTIIKDILENTNANIHRIKYGYNNVICKRAKDFCEENKDVCYIPFGMECEENIESTKDQVLNIPKEVKRIVIPIGSGMNFISVCNGLQQYGIFDKTVVGIQVGKDPSKVIKKYLNAKDIDIEILKSEYDYHETPKQTNLCGVELDPIYESKCIDFLQKGDLLWIVGKRL